MTKISKCCAILRFYSQPGYIPLSGKSDIWMLATERKNRNEMNKEDRIGEDSIEEGKIGKTDHHIGRLLERRNAMMFYFHSSAIVLLWLFDAFLICLYVCSFAYLFVYLYFRLFVWHSINLFVILSVKFHYFLALYDMFFIIRLLFSLF